MMSDNNDFYLSKGDIKNSLGTDRIKVTSMLQKK